MYLLLALEVRRLSKPVILRKIYVQARSAFAFGWLNGVVATKRNPLWVINYLVAPLSFLVFISIFAREEMLGYAMVGGLLMTITSNGIGLMGDTVFYKNTIKLQDMMVASPMTPLAYLGGLVLSGLFFAVPGLIIFWALMAKYGLLTLSNIHLLALASLFSLASLSGIGFTLATFVKEERFVWPLLGILTFALTVLPPVYYPHTLLPQFLRLIAIFIPTSGTAMIFHKHTGLLESLVVPEIVIWTVLLAESIIFLGIAMYRSRWREV